MSRPAPCVNRSHESFACYDGVFCGPTRFIAAGARAMVGSTVVAGAVRDSNQTGKRSWIEGSWETPRVFRVQPQGQPGREVAGIKPLARHLASLIGRSVTCFAHYGNRSATLGRRFGSAGRSGGPMVRYVPRYARMTGPEGSLPAALVTRTSLLRHAGFSAET